MFPRKQSATQPDCARLKINMDILQRMTKLRPYDTSAAESNAILKDLESQLIAKTPIMKLADYIAFADGAEAYMRQKYGDETAFTILGSRRHWTGLLKFKQDMTMLWDSLDDKMQERLLHEPIYEIMRDMVNKALPSGGNFLFK